MERIGKALPPETVTELSRLTRVMEPETIATMLRTLQFVPVEAIEGFVRALPGVSTVPPLEWAVVRRAMRAVLGADVHRLAEEDLARIASEETDAEVLLELLSSAALMDALEEKDPLAEARLRGFEEQRRLMREAGGAIGTVEAAQVLGISRQAVDARRKRGRLLALGNPGGGRGWRYPLAQFDSASGDGVVRGIERALAAVEDEGGWMALAFLLSPEERLGGRRPIDALKEGVAVEDVERAARLYGEHVAY